MHAIWRVRPADPRKAEALARASGVDPITAQLLLNRGVHDAPSATRFLHPTLESLDDPDSLPDITQAIARINRAIAQRESIFIFGDSDVDGLTASVILYEALRRLGGMVRAKQSNRIRDGYGVPQKLVQQLCRSSTTLILLVDCGTNQPDAIRQLAAHGIDTIIVDHHVPLKGWAQPHALVNPHRDASGAHRGLCSAGLALKVVQALLRDEAEEGFGAYLDLAALGTLADYCPLLGDNRTIVREGLGRIVQSHREGLQRLCESTHTTAPDPEHVIRRLVPRLNASGRLGDPSAIWHLLLSEEHQRVDEWLSLSEAAHVTTKQLHRQTLGEAQEQINRLHFRDQYVLVVSRQGWHQGVMGPLASRLAQSYGRPAIAIAMDEQCGTGSGRSIPLLNLLDVLQACESLLMRFGGHAQACGMTVDRAQLEPFRAMVNQQAQRLLGREGLVKTRTVDVELPLSAVSGRWVEEIEQFAPFGPGNERPSVVIRQVAIDHTSPRRAVLSRETTHVAAKGKFPTPNSGGHYDVVASPAVVSGELVLTVSDVRVSTALS